EGGMRRVGVWATARGPDGPYTVAADLSRLPGAHVVARPEDPLPAGARRVSVFRRPRAMAALLRLKAVADAALGAAAVLEASLTAWPEALGEAALGLARPLVAGRRWVALAALALLVPAGFVAVWLLVALSQLMIAAARTACAPLAWFPRAADHLARHDMLRADPAEVVRRAGCDVWVVPALECDFPYPAGVPAVAVTRGDGPADVLALRREQARLWAARLVDHVPALDELGEVTAPADPLPAVLAAAPAGPPGVLLFLPRAYQGGVWEAARTLINALAAVNACRRRLTLTLAVPAEQRVTGLADGVAVERLEMRVLTRDGEPVSVPFAPSSAGAAAWFALVERFPAAVWPARPLGLIIHDVIQMHAPECFEAKFHLREWPITRRTVARADLVISTTEVTRRDVMKAYGLDERQTRLVPVACEPARRFDHLTPRRVGVPDGCVLNPTNSAPHKGAEVMLRGFALLREKAEVGPLVLCGAETDRFGPGYRGPLTPYWARVRRLAARLGLRPGADVYFLGYVDDAQLLDLMTRCRVVVNAARYDNGTYSLIEAHHFGKPTVCSRYPAAEELYGRFGVPARYFAVEDAASLAEALREALAQPALDVAAARQSLADPRHSYERYAEEVYESLLALAARGAGRAAA
ncbi:MAG: glycosyltransferase, partial [Gemmataceae bacterium]